MKFSLRSIKHLNKMYSTTPDITAIGNDELLNKISVQLGTIDQVDDIGPKYKDALIVKVVSVEKHPDADKLHVCRIDDGGKVKDVERGDDGLIQVVCGAPNVHAGMMAVWLPPGATVPETLDKEPFVLETREIRGQPSNGMLASPKELELGSSHDGIMEIDSDHAPGSSFAGELGLDGDLIIDIENKMFTHRPDLFGLIGISRELAGIQDLSFKSPDWYDLDPKFPEIEDGELKISLTNELPELVKRFCLIAMSGIEVKPSPLWLQLQLIKHDLKPINNIVDYTNFFMLLTSQPLHAYDYDKLKALSQDDQASFEVRNPRPGEKIKLLNGKEVEPRQEAIVIATDKALLGIAGIMGGSESEVDENTKNIVLESGNFDMYSVRRTSMEHGLFTDASTRFTKGQSPLQNTAVLARIVDQIRTEAGGKVASKLIDSNQLDETVLKRGSLHPEIKLSADFINLRLGSQLSADEMRKVLTNVEFKVDGAKDELIVSVPFWRTDIELREDVVEEVGRLQGYDKLPLKLPVRDLTPVKPDKLLLFKSVIRNLLSEAGANEILSYSFVDKDLMTKVGQDPGLAYELSNALSPDLQYYRLSLTPSLMSKVNPNVKSGYGRFAVYELGKAHIVNQLTGADPTEYERLALVYVNSSKSSKGAADSFYNAKYYLETLLSQLHVQGSVTFKPIDQSDLDISLSSQLSYHQPGRSALVSIGDNYIGVVGEYKESVRRALKLPDKVAGFELDLNAIIDSFSLSPHYTPLSTFPKVMQDITLKLPASTSYEELFNLVNDSLSELKPKDCTYTLEPLDIYQKDEKSEEKNVSLRLIISSYERTLTDKQVNELLERVAERAKAKLGATRV